MLLIPLHLLKVQVVRVHLMQVFMTMDVGALYTNIPHEKAMEVLENILENHVHR